MTGAVGAVAQALGPKVDNSNAKGRAKNAMGFKAENLNFHDQLEQCPSNQKVIMVNIKAAKNLPFTDAITCTTDPFCRVDLMQPVQDFNQLQRTSQLCSTVNPEWSDDSRFYFIVEDESKFMFSVMKNFGMNAKIANMLGKRKFLGDAVMKAADFTSELREYVLPLIDPETGRMDAELIIEGVCMSKDEALYSRYDVCYQYQRHNMSWKDDLLPTDPGRFSNKYNTFYGSGFSDVADEIPDGWSVVEQWSTMANEHGHGWLYAIDFGSSSWYSEKSPIVFVRRKAWTRRVARNDIAESILAPKADIDDDVDTITKKVGAASVEDSDQPQEENLSNN